MKHIPGPRLSPPRLPVVAMTDLRHGWQAPYCVRCHSRMWLDIPTLGVRGAIACLMCSREAAEVIDRYPLQIVRSEIEPARRQAEYRERKAVAV